MPKKRKRTKKSGTAASRSRAGKKAAATRARKHAARSRAAKKAARTRKRRGTTTRRKVRVKSPTKRRRTTARKKTTRRKVTRRRVRVRAPKKKTRKTMNRRAIRVTATGILTTGLTALLGFAITRKGQAWLQYGLGKWGISGWGGQLMTVGFAGAATWISYMLLKKFVGKGTAVTAATGGIVAIGDQLLTTYSPDLISGGWPMTAGGGGAALPGGVEGYGMFQPKLSAYQYTNQQQPGFGAYRVA